MANSLAGTTPHLSSTRISSTTGAEVRYFKRGKEHNCSSCDEDNDVFADDQSPGSFEDVDEEDTLASHQDCCNSSDEDSDEDNDDPRKDPDFIPPASLTIDLDSEEIFGTKPLAQRNMTKLKATSAVLSRTMISSRKAAILLNAFLEDLKLLTEKTKVCPSKVYDSRGYWGKLCIKEKEDLIKNTGGAQAVYLDERKDLTTVIQLVDTSVSAGGDNYNGKTRVSRMIKEEHCPIIVHNKNLDKETYLRTLAPEKSNAITLAQLVYNLLGELGFKEDLQIFASDSCNKMSGH